MKLNGTIDQHDSFGYAPRTAHNAASAEITIAVAADFTTAGERLPKKVALEHSVGGYYHYNIHGDPVKFARELYVVMRDNKYTTLNIAGNGIYTMAEYGYSQEMINMWMYTLLKPLHEHLGLTQIVSGGQSGVDMAGLVVAEYLGIPYVGTFPKGFKQRWEDGVDKTHRKWDIITQITEYTENLRSRL